MTRQVLRSMASMQPLRIASTCSGLPAAGGVSAPQAAIKNNAAGIRTRGSFTISQCLMT
jgi:hypothetical protein